MNHSSESSLSSLDVTLFLEHRGNNEAKFVLHHCLKYYVKKFSIFGLETSVFLFGVSILFYPTYLYKSRSWWTWRICPRRVPPLIAGSGWSSRAFFNFRQHWSKHCRTWFQWYVDLPTSFVSLSGSESLREDSTLRIWTFTFNTERTKFSTASIHLFS